MRNRVAAGLAKARQFNTWLALHVVRTVATMWCAYAFAGLALISLPTAIAHGTAALVAWTAQTFIQLVLLSVIMVGQDQQGAKTERNIQETHDTVMTEQAEIKQLIGVIHQHLGIGSD